MANARSLPAPNWMPRSAGGVRVDGRRAVIPLSLATLAMLAFGFHVPWFVVVPLGCIVPLLYLAGAVYASRALPEFEREFNRRTMRGDVAGLWTLYRDARWLRWVAPTYRMRSKLGLILSLRGEHRNADRVLDEAWVLAPKHRRAELLGPLARTKYAVGDHEALRALAEQWRQRSLFPGAANVYLAAALLNGPDGDGARAAELLAEAEGQLSGTDAELAERLRAKLPA